MKYLFHNPYRKLEKLLGYSFRNKDLLVTALVHRSLRFERGGVDDNQRLEFLGDAALSLVSGDYLYRNYPDLREGDLTSLRSRLTSGKTLANIGRELGLGEWLQLGKGERKSGGQDRASNITDAFEAVIGAAYLDGGIRAVTKIFNRLFVALMEEVKIDDPFQDNFKGRLQEVVQRRWKTNPRYRVVSQSGPAHERVFCVSVVINGVEAGSGRGKSKRDAEQDAARDALSRLPP